MQPGKQSKRAIIYVPTLIATDDIVRNCNFQVIQLGQIQQPILQLPNISAINREHAMSEFVIPFFVNLLDYSSLILSIIDIIQPLYILYDFKLIMLDSSKIREQTYFLIQQLTQRYLFINQIFILNTICIDIAIFVILSGITNLDYNQMQMKEIFLFFLAILCCSCLSNTPTFKATNKYIETGTFTLNTASYYGDSSWLAVEQVDFNINLITARTGSASYRAQVSLQDLNFDVTPSRQFNISIEICSRYPTYLYVCLFSQRLNYLQALKARYIVLDQPIITRIRFFSLYREGAGIAITNGSPHSAAYTVSAINQAGTTKIFAILNGFNLTAPDANIKLDLKIAGSFVDSTTVSFQFSTTVPETIVINSIGFVYAGYNQVDIGAWPFPATRITMVSLSGSGSSAVYTDSANVMKSYNTFWGLTRFNVNNQPSIRFSSSLSGSTLQGGSALPFNSIEFLAMIFQFKECSSSTPYYMVATDICYDICPIRYYKDTTVPNTCQLCINYDCKKCLSTGDCTQCSSTSDFRTLNSGTKRCDPLIGYYDDGTTNPIAQPCNNNCKGCINTAVECTSCKSGFLLNGGTKICEACPNSCDICSTTAICTTCKIGFLRNVGTNLCQACPAYCDICSTTSVCTSCSQGYKVNLNNCVPQAKQLSTGFLILIILIPVLLVSICLICIICYCCKKRDRKVVQQQTIVNQPPIQINYEGQYIARQQKMISKSNISHQRNNRQDFMIQEMNDQSEVQIKLSQTIFHDKVKIRGQKTLY